MAAKSTFISNSASKAQIDIVRETRVGRLASRGTAMINKYVAMGLGALIALAPLAVLPQAAQAQTDTTTAAPMAKPAHTGSHRSHVRRKGNTAAHRARASAHHMHKMRTAPAAAPKS
jgi:hypothetical protein